MCACMCVEFIIVDFQATYLTMYNNIVIIIIDYDMCTDPYASKPLKRKINACMEHDIYSKKSVILVYLYIV